MIWILIGSDRILTNDSRQFLFYILVKSCYFSYYTLKDRLFIDNSNKKYPISCLLQKEKEF